MPCIRCGLCGNPVRNVFCDVRVKTDRYGRFKVAEGIEGVAIFTSDLMAPVAGNADKELPAGCRDKMMVSFEVDNVDEAFETLSARGVEFVNRPTDMPGWGMRVVHLRDPEENLIELFTPLAANL